jgi:hypothetical protein
VGWAGVGCPQGPTKKLQVKKFFAVNISSLPDHPQKLLSLPTPKSNFFFPACFYLNIILALNHVLFMDVKQLMTATTTVGKLLRRPFQQCLCRPCMLEFGGQTWRDFATISRYDPPRSTPCQQPCLNGRINTTMRFPNFEVATRRWRCCRAQPKPSRQNSTISQTRVSEHVVWRGEMRDIVIL